MKPEDGGRKERFVILSVAKNLASEILRFAQDDTVNIQQH
jgi:hypothetical protein